MQYVVDIVLIFVFVFSIVTAAKKGFFKTLFELVVYIVSVIAARVISASVAPTVFDNYFSGNVRERLSDALGNAGAKDYAAQIESTLKSIPDSFDGVMKMIGVSKESLLERVSQSDFSEGNIVDSVMDKLVSPIGVAIVRTVVFVALTIVFLVVLRLVVRLLDKMVKKLPAIKQVNSSLGAVLGAVKGIILVIILSLLLGIVASFTASDSFINAVNDSLIINAIQGFMASISGYSV